MSDTLRSTTLTFRTDPLEAATPQPVAPWPDVLAFLRHLEALAAAGTAFQLVETPGQVACVTTPAASQAPVPAAPPTRRTTPQG